MIPVPGHKVTTKYKKKSPKGRPWSLGWHTGSDFEAAVGTPIVSATPGRVIAANAYDKSYGYKVIIRWGSYDVWYCHMPKGAATVRVGQTVDAGDLIGAVGDEGNVTGPHLHLELRTAGAGFAAASFHDPMIAVNYEDNSWLDDVKNETGDWVVDKLTLTGRSTPEYKTGNVRAVRAKGKRLYFTKTVHHDGRWWHYRPADGLWYQQRSADGQTLFMRRTASNNARQDRSFVAAIDGLILREQPYPGQPTGTVLAKGEAFSAIGWEGIGATRWWVDADCQWASEKYLTEPTAGGAPGPRPTLRVVGANLYGGYTDKDKDWGARAAKVAAKLVSLDADVIVALELHEAEAADLDGFHELLGGSKAYTMVLGGDGTPATWDGNVLFVRPSRVSVLAVGGVWLYGKRHLDVYQLQDLASGRSYVVPAVHLIAGKPYTRCAQMAEARVFVRSWAVEVGAKGVPVVWVGDFNNDAVYEGSPLEQLQADGYQTLTQRLGPKFVGGERPSHHGGKDADDIDHILTRPAEVTVVAAQQVNTDGLGGDHDWNLADITNA